MLTDGRYIYVVAETRAAAKSEFKLFAYDPLQSYKCTSATVLQGEPSFLLGDTLSRFALSFFLYRSVSHAQVRAP
jgi:hypothetical protein